MKIQYCSDLHLEFTENARYIKANPIIPEGEILIMAGDILPFDLHKHKTSFLDYVSDHFQMVYWIPGNHEYYHSDIGKMKTNMLEKIRSNVLLLNNHVMLYKNVELVFSTMWSHVSPRNSWHIQNNVSDFYHIKHNEKRLTPSDFNSLHKNDLSFIKTSLAQPTDNKRIVVTHHVPTLLNYPEQYKGSSINEAFAVELHDYIFDAGPDYWIFGHHHSNTPAFKIGNTTLLTNQLGYVSHGEHGEFRRGAVIEV